VALDLRDEKEREEEFMIREMIIMEEDRLKRG